MKFKWQNIQIKLFKYKKVISSVGSIVRSFSDYAVTRTPLALAGGVYEAAEKILNLKAWSGFDHFNPSNNWYPLFSSDITSKILASTLKDIPGESLDFEHSSTKLLKLQGISFIVIADNWGEGQPNILCQPEDKEKLLQLLADMKFKELGSCPFLELNEVDRDKRNVEITAAPMKVFKSKNADMYIEYLSNAYEKGLTNRSIAFWGLPGVGKTSISSAMIDHFNFRTLKFKPTEHLTLNVLLEVIDLFKIQAVILDDMDRLYTDEKLLNFLDVLNTKVKLTIGVCNSLLGLDPALLRPGRFDEVIKIEKLDESTMKVVLKDLYEEYHEKVAEFPVAYVGELHKQFIMNPANVANKFEELKGRVEKLKEFYMERHEKKPPVKDLDSDDETTPAKADMKLN